MKLAWIAASLLTALDCYEKAVGLRSQELFSADAQWVWWIAAAGWLYVAMMTLVGDYGRRSA